MRVDRLLNQNIDVYRMEEVGTGRMSYTKVLSDVKAAIFNSNLQKEQIDTGVFSKRFILYADYGTDIREGDRIEDKNGNSYTAVSGGVSQKNMGRIRYMKIIMEKA